jgi:Domain of unknown function (DUF3850)
MTAPSTTRPAVPARVHHLACFDRWYLALAQGIKTYELRQADDRDFQRGDLLRIASSADPDAVGLWYLVTHVRVGDENSGIRPGWAPDRQGAVCRHSQERGCDGSRWMSQDLGEGWNRGNPRRAQCAHAADDLAYALSAIQESAEGAYCQRNPVERARAPRRLTISGVRGAVACCSLRGVPSSSVR